MAVGGAKWSRSARRGWGVPGDARRRGACALSLVAALTVACGARSRDADASGGVSGKESDTDGGAIADSGAIATDSGAPDSGMPGPCAGQTHGPSGAVTGTVRGAGVDAVVSETGLVTTFLGPGASGSSPFGQTFSPTNDATGKLVDQFVFAVPSDVVTASLAGWAGATAAEVGSYPSQGCAGFVFEMAFPLPAGVVCPSMFAPCGPDCEPHGEAAVCEPAHPKRRYRASREGPCFSSGPADEGEWQLELSSVCSQPIAGTLINFETHGHLSATLINEADASDQVGVNLDF